MKPCCLLVLLISIPAIKLLAQAPMDRQPPAPASVSAPAPPSPPVAWEVFASKSHGFIGNKVTVRASPSNARCILDEVTPDAIRCHQAFTALPPLIPVLPRRDFDLDRASVKAVWSPNRAASGWLGFGVGFGSYAGEYAANNSQINADVLILVGGVVGAIGAFIGYELPLIHHVLYRAR